MTLETVIEKLAKKNSSSIKSWHDCRGVNIKTRGAS